MLLEKRGIGKEDLKMDGIPCSWVSFAKCAATSQKYSS
jgi:hypothetical protein